MSVLLTGLAISAVAYVLAFITFVRCGLSRGLAILFAAPFATSPLVIAISGAGSYLYAIDFAVPFLAVSAWRRFPFLPSHIRAAAALLLFGAGFYPFVVSLVYAFGDRHQLLFMGISFYRLIGTVSIFVCAATFFPQNNLNAITSGRILLPFAWLSVVLLAAVIFQAIGIDSNTFYRWGDAAGQYDEASTGYAVVGLFRASLGIAGLFGIAAALAVRGRGAIWLLLMIIGAVCGSGVILATSSKTSLLAGLGLVGLAVLLSFRQISISKIVFVTVLTASTSVAVYEYFDLLPKAVRNSITGVLGGEESSWSTWHDRQSRVNDTLETLASNPQILVGVGLDPRFVGARWAYYHNEYIGIIMHGGVVSFIPYLLGLGILTVALIRRAFLTGLPLPVFGLLVIAMGIVQAMSASHIVPGIYFSSISAFFGMAYGFALNPLASTSEAQLAYDQQDAYNEPVEGYSAAY